MGLKYSPDDYTDVGQGRKLVEVFKGRIAYNESLGFMVYNGKKWSESEIGAQGLAQVLTDLQKHEAREFRDEAQREIDKAVDAGDGEAKARAIEKKNNADSYEMYANKRRKSSAINACLKECRPDCYIPISKIDADGFLLNTPAGTVDLNTGSMKPHDWQDYCTKITGCSPDASRGADEFGRFLDAITCNDMELKQYLQLVAGMAAIGKVMQEKLVIAFGGGGNGKSTYWNLLQMCLGDYAGSVSADLLTLNYKDSGKKFEKATFRGRRLVVAAELEEGQRMNTAMVKQLCSTDTIHAEKKHKDAFDFQPSHSLVLFTNHLPRVSTTDKGTWDRIAVVPFNARFRGTGGEKKNYAAELFKRCGGAVLAWMIEGARLFIAGGYNLPEPDAVRDAVDEYRNANNWLKKFLDDYCEVGKFQESAGAIYGRYKTYCEESGEFPKRAAAFKEAMEMAGFEWKKTMIGAMYSGVRIRQNRRLGVVR